ncbi:peptidoglycan-binding protein [Streptomyces sp. NPDC058595]|uniref:peptidoglycan-binding domain-containing protein n=1 Tax=Streptomyces sp. NPDC058595 TaxID=3346550 RepID=UPI003665B58B
MTGQHCPECGTPRDAYGRSGAGCDCAERAATAAAEGFDPLRIRPYVALEDPNDAVPPVPAPAPPPPLVHDAAPSIPPPPPLYGGDRSEGGDPAETMRLSLPGLRTTGPRPAVEPKPGGRRTFAMVALTAAAVAVIGTASFAGGLFTGDDGGDEATSDLNSGPATASVEPDPSASTSRPMSGSASASPSASASASKPATSGPPSPAAEPPAPSRTPSKAPAPDGAATARTAGPGLRLGDSGPEVEELQRRLSEVWLYNGGYDGQYSDRVETAVRVYQSYKSIEGDPSGVYGPGTRRALEAETSGQGREQGGGGPGGGGPGGNGPGGNGPGRGEDWRD